MKGINFKDHVYVGDPINAVNIFNAKKADELIFLDIEASRKNRIMPLGIVEKIADECYMPFAVGGGIKDVEEIKKILNAGAEKVIINTASVLNPSLIRQAADAFGSQSVVVSIDAKKNIFGKYRVCIYSGSKSTGIDPVKHAVDMQKAGAGEIMINSIDNEGGMNGYDLELIKKISSSVGLPVIACGGAGRLDDLSKAIKDGGASAMAAGSLFVFHGKKRGVLINYPSRKEIENLFNDDKY